jgi:hypothetical protein
MSRKILWRLQGESVNIDFTQSEGKIRENIKSPEQRRKQIKLNARKHAPATEQKSVRRKGW